MHVIAHCSGADKEGDQFTSALEGTLARGLVARTTTLPELRLALQRVFPDPPVLVVMTRSQEELREIAAAEEMTADHRLVLIVPDDTPETAALAHRLHPRYLSSDRRDAAAVAAVLRRLLLVER